MPNKRYPGKLIVIEGIDGSGKATQTKLLARHLKKEGYRVKTIDFPQYGKKSAGLVEEYLNGKYGSSEKVGPYQAAIFYAADRFDGSFKIRKWLEENRVVVSDRYLPSNICHQGGKIKDRKERTKFVTWLKKLEYGIFGVPSPDITVILETSPEISRKLSPLVTDKGRLKKRKIYLGNKKRDIHERDREHLRRALEIYLEIAKKNSKEFKVINCIKGGKLLSPTEIHRQVWERVKTILPLGVKIK